MGILREYSTESILIANRLGGLNQHPKFLGYNDQYDAFRHAPIENLVDSLVALVPPTGGQMRFSSDYHHTALAPLMAAGWQ